ncbi:MAG: ABC transporter permease [Clostridia bacterium]|nr:ABC transporter permease [Clostridia bacterium]
MNVKENIRIALMAIRANKMRSFLTMLGIIIGVGSVIAIMTIGNTGKDFLIQKINEAGGQSVYISVESDSERYTIDGLTEDDLDLIRSIDIVSYVLPEEDDMGGLSTRSMPDGICSITAVTDDYQQAMNIKTDYGRWFNKDEVTAHAKVCLISEYTAKNFFHSQNPVGKTIDIQLNDQLISLKIIGISTDVESSLFSVDDIEEMMAGFGMEFDFSKIGYVYMPVTTYMDVYGETEYSGVSVVTYDVNDLDRAGAEAVGMLNARHGVLDDSVYKATNMATLVDLLDTVINVFTIFISSVGAISLVVGGVGVMNIMLVSVTERTREIGIRKALGARTNVILFQFLTESVIICVIGGLIGMAIGFGLSYAVSVFMGIIQDINNFNSCWFLISYWYFLWNLPGTKSCEDAAD